MGYRFYTDEEQLISLDRERDHDVIIMYTCMCAIRKIVYELQKTNNPLKNQPLSLLKKVIYELDQTVREAITNKLNFYTFLSKFRQNQIISKAYLEDSFGVDKKYADRIIAFLVQNKLAIDTEQKNRIFREYKLVTGYNNLLLNIRDRETVLQLKLEL